MNPRTLLIILSTALLAVALPSAGEEEADNDRDKDKSQVSLPDEARRLLDQMEFWEAAQRAELERQIREKRSAVVAALKRQLEDVTANGELESALALRDRIEGLEQLNDNTFIVGKWQFEYHGAQRQYTFAADGTFSGQFPGSGRDYSGEWSAEGRTVNLFRKGEEKLFGSITLARGGKALLKNGTYLMEGEKAE